MKRIFISIIIIWTALIIAWPIFGQNEGREDKQGREGLRRSRDLPAEERIRLRAGRPSIGREAQLKVIEAIEEQLAKLKKTIQAGPDREAFRKFREASPEQQAKLRQQWQKARQEQQQMINAIQGQLTKLAGPRPTKPDLTVTELRAIYKLAIVENAKRTAERIEKLIAKYQRGTESRPAEPARPERPSDRPVQPKED